MGTAYTPYLHTYSFSVVWNPKLPFYLPEAQETMTAEAEEGGVKNFHNDKYNAVTFIT
jgi:hypothetical protein